MKVRYLIFSAFIGLLTACDGDKQKEPPNDANRKTIKSLTFADSALTECVQRAAQNLAVNYVDELTNLNCNNKITTYKPINNITDIGQLAALTQIDLSYHNIKNANFSTLANLKQLYLWSNPIAQLNLTSNNALLDLEVSTFADDGKALTSQFGLLWPSQPELESVRFNLPESYTLYLYPLKNLKRATVLSLTEPFVDRLAAPNLEYLSLAGTTPFILLPGFTKPVDVQIKSTRLTRLDMGNNTNIKSLQLDTPKLASLSVINSLISLSLQSTGITALDISPAANLAQLTLGANPNLTQVSLDPAQASINITHEGSLQPEFLVRKALKYLNFASAELAQCVYSQKVSFVDELTDLTCDSADSWKIQTLKGIEQLQQLERVKILYDELTDANFSGLTKLVSIMLHTSRVATLPPIPAPRFNLRLPEQSPLTQLELVFKPRVTLPEPLDLQRFDRLGYVDLLGIQNVIFGATADLSRLRLEGDFPVSSLPQNMDNIAYLSLDSTAINTLNLPTMPKLNRLVLVLPKLLELTLPQLPNLRELSLANMPIRRLDLAHLNSLETIDVSVMANLSQLHIPNTPSLNSLSAYDTGIVNWDFSGNAALAEIAIWSDATLNIKGIDGTRLTNLEVFGDQVNSISLQSCDALENLYLGGAQIKSFNFADCPSLVRLGLSGTAINSLDLTNHSQLEFIELVENPIALDRIKLPGEINYYNNPGCVQSDLPSCQF